MPTLSVILITNNEANNIRRALDSVKFADEIIINDSGSTDGTLKSRKDTAARSSSSEFAGFGAAKQTALDAAKSDWVLSIDADEEIDETLATAIKQAIKNSEHSGYYAQSQDHSFSVAGYCIPAGIPIICLACFDVIADDLRVTVYMSGLRSMATWAGLEGHILHYTDPDIEHYLDKLNRYTTLSADSLQRQGRRFKALAT